MTTMDSPKSLRSRIAELEAELEDKNNDLYTSAKIGKTLLDANQELENKLELNTKELNEKIESLEQERYTLQMKIDRQKATYEAVNQELESRNSQMVKNHAFELAHLKQTHGMKIRELNSLNEGLKSENEKLEIQVHMNAEKLLKQDQIIEQLQHDFQNQSNISSFQQELQDVEQLYVQEKAAMQKAKVQLVDLEGKVEVLSTTNSTLQQRLISLEEECQERCRMANEWYEKLKEANDQNSGLSSQLENLKLELRSDYHHKSGNSLFGEVDDRRLDVERKMLSLQVKYDSLVKAHTATTQHFKKMKAEMSALLCRCAASTAHAGQVQRLQQALAQSKSEVQEYMSKLHKSERKLVGVDFAQDRKRFAAAFVDFGNKTEYVQFLEKELERTKSEHVFVLKELDLKRTQHLWESNKLSETETKLYHCEQEQVKHKKEVTKLKIKMQELLEKIDQANAANKELETDKKFLEDRLKSCRRCVHSFNESAAPADFHSKSQHSDLDNKSENSVQDNGGESCAGDSKTKTRHRVINILEELDQEFNKHKEEEPTSGMDRQVRGRSNPRRMLENSSGIHGIQNKGTQLATVKDNSINQCPQQ